MSTPVSDIQHHHERVSGVRDDQGAHLADPDSPRAPESRQTAKRTRPETSPVSIQLAPGVVADVTVTRTGEVRLCVPGTVTMSAMAACQLGLALQEASRVAAERKQR